MSKADDLSLLAMQAARMSPRAMASALGWELERTAKRLEQLNRPAAPAKADAPAAAIDPTPRPAIPAIDEKPLADGEGLVLRSFALTAGGFGANCMIAGGATLYVATGRERVEPGKRIRVERVRRSNKHGAPWRRVEEPADA